MATIRQEIEYQCFDDCVQSGCPKHRMTLTIQTVSEVLIVEVDGKQWFGSDPSQWDALKTMLIRSNYNQFDLTNPND